MVAILRVEDSSLSRQEPANAIAPDAPDVDVKQEVDEADVDRINIELLAQDIAREAALFEQAHLPPSEGLDNAPSAVTAAIVEAATDSVPSHEDDESSAASPDRQSEQGARDAVSIVRSDVGDGSVNAAASDPSVIQRVDDSEATGTERELSFRGAESTTVSA